MICQIFLLFLLVSQWLANVVQCALSLKHFEGYGTILRYQRRDLTRQMQWSLLLMIKALGFGKS